MAAAATSAPATHCYRSLPVSGRVISRASPWRSFADVTLITICAVTLSRAKSQGFCYLYRQIHSNRPRPRCYPTARRSASPGITILLTIICGLQRLGSSFLNFVRKFYNVSNIFHVKVLIKI